MRIQSESHESLIVVRPHGDINKSDAAELDELLDAAIDDGARLMVFDCSGLSHISSDGLKVLLKTLRRLRDTDGRAVLAATSGRVHSVMEASGLITLMQAYDSPEEAIAALNNGNDQLGAN
ncbi:MAG: STAS domain-containing protein [Oxalobacteraceae bacterium]|jgi:anti-anti-sigma factor|nr:STAS domain-containing protein [Oxalobacteraceae bacterium]MCE2831742.1 STAS domain-containing protein [Oxalobacteraceae bacterium]